MAEISSSTSPESTTEAAAAADPTSNEAEPASPNQQENQVDPPVAPLPPPPPTQPQASSTPHPNPNPNPSNITSTPPPTSFIPPPSIQPYGAAGTVPSTAPSFRPATPPLPQFSPLPPNPSLPQAVSFQTPGAVPPPGVSALPLPPPPVMMPPRHRPPVSGAGQAAVPSSIPQTMPPLYAPAGQSVRQPYLPMHNGYPAIPQPSPQGTILPPGIMRYPSPYGPLVWPAYPPRQPGAVAVIPQLSRTPLVGLRSPIMPPLVQQAIMPIVVPAEKPQTTVYVGKISSTVENDFVLSLLQVCGPVKSWKRAQDPTNGTFKGYGFCEFESAEGVLRALRLLSKLNIDGQELMLNVSQATREYLEHYVEKKVESSKNLKETETEGSKNHEGDTLGDKKNEMPTPSEELPKPLTAETKKDDHDIADKENTEAASLGLVTDEDRQADQETLEKLTGMIEERLKSRPLPPPPPSQTAVEASTNSNLEVPSRSKDGDMDVDTGNVAADDKNDNEIPTENKPSGEQDKTETSSPDRDRRNDRRSRDRERDLKREKERELERYEREREQERAKREKEREYRTREDERRYKTREKEWESREREREHWRKREKEKEKDRAQERKWDVSVQERESDDGHTKKRKYRSSSDEDRRRRQKEKEEDLADRLKEEEEVVEDKRRADEELLKKQEEEEAAFLSGHALNGSDGAVFPLKTNIESMDKPVEHTSDHGSHVTNGEGIMQNGIDNEPDVAAVTATDAQHNNNAPAKKLGFGLLGSGKRTTVLSVFNQDEDEDSQKEKKMRPLVPIDYSTDEQLAVQFSASEAPPSNLVAAAEFARRISSVTAKEEKPDMGKERSRRPHDRHSQRDRERNINDNTRIRDESKKEDFDRDRFREHGRDKVKAPDNQKLLDAKQLIDMIPKTKDELFSYEINWEMYDRNTLHERMKPWISKKITEFLGEEEPTLVDYIMSSTREHVKAAEMLDRLQGILDEEAEMFVLKMWRMLIFEIKRVETGLALRSR